jgi:hypothetical protein
MAISAIAFAGAQKAQASPELVDLTVMDRDTGQPLRIWRHKGRMFVEGQPGARYSLRVTNRTHGRVLVVMSVDGVNVITGETAGYGQRGYVFNPHQSYDVSGWRKSDTEVAAFTFAALPQSYAARTGRPGDVGVVGIAVFQERVMVPAPISPATESRPEQQSRSDPRVEEGAVMARRAAPPSSPPAARMAPSADAVVTAQRREEKLGTGHGAREWSEARVVPFQRATRYPQFIRRIEYDTHANLVASGVIQPSWAGRRPRPFPANGDGVGYAPDPPGWP